MEDLELRKLENIEKRQLVGLLKNDGSFFIRLLKWCIRITNGFSNRNNLCFRKHGACRGRHGKISRACTEFLMRRWEGEQRGDLLRCGADAAMEKKEFIF